LRAAGKHYQPSPLPSRRIEEVPIVMVALPHQDVSDATLYSLREAVGRSLGIRPGARLACVTVISGSEASNTDSERSETALRRQHITRMLQWTQGLDLNNHQASYHVLESGDVAQALLQYAQTNHVNMIIMGAATHGLQMQRFMATVPIKVAMEAPCTVILVKQSLPFEALAG
jgi:eukaryotic-like serine/threonine-protein kinase